MNLLKLSKQTNCSLTNELILMKLYIVVVYDLRMCLKEDNPGQKKSHGRSFKGDNYMCGDS